MPATHDRNTILTKIHRKSEDEVYQQVDKGVASTSATPVTVFTSPIETIVTMGIAANGAMNFDVSLGSIEKFEIAATANWTINFRASATKTLSSLFPVGGGSITVVFQNLSGATAYFPNGFSVDGVSVTPKWAGGTAPTAGTASSVDEYRFTILKNSVGTISILAAVISYK